MVDSPADKVLQGGEIIGLANDTILTSREGTEYQIADSAAPIQPEAGDLLGVVLVFRDVTEKYERRRRMERQNDLFAKAQDLANVGAWEYDVRSGEAIWTEEVYHIHGLPPDVEASLEQSLQFYHEEDRPVVEEAFARAIEEGEPYDLERRLIAAEGNERWVRTRGKPQTVDGEVVCVRGTIQDITDRKERERRLEAVFNHTYQFTGLMEPDGTLIEANDTALEFGGLTEEDVLGTPIWETYWFQMGQETKQRLRESIQQAAEGEFVRYEEQIRGAEDTRIIDFSIRPVTNEDGEVVLLVPEGRDITERKEQEQELAHQKALLEAQAESTIDGLLAVDGQRKLAFYNEKFLDIWEIPESFAERDPVGKSLDEVLLDYVNDQLKDPEEFREKVEYLYGHPEEESRELIQLTDGRWLDRYSAPIVGDNGTHFGRLLVFRDVTERREREERLREAKEEAERMNQLKSAFLANMSHEIRTPLTSILGFAEMIGEQVSGDEKGAVPRFARLIEKSGRRLMDTLTGVLNLSKLEAGEMNLLAEPVDLTEEAREIVEQFQPRAEEAVIDLQVDPGKTQVWALGDEGGIRIILRNLVSNAVKYTEEGGQVWVRTYQEDQVSILEVQDTGIGMDPETVPDLFEAFTQESEGIGREYEGTGLGLAVTKEAVDRMDGTIEVDTERGEGSCFTVRLPRDDG